jgi:hypothetical protein
MLGVFCFFLLFLSVIKFSKLRSVSLFYIRLEEQSTMLEVRVRNRVGVRVSC